MSALSCSRRDCGEKRHSWNPFRKKGHLFEGLWYCSADCLNAALTQSMRRFLENWTHHVTPLPRARLGLILVEKGLITHRLLQQALEAQRLYGGSLGQRLLQMGAISRRQLTEALSEQQGLPWIEELRVEPSEEVLRQIPRKLCLDFRFCPVEYNPRTSSLVLAVSAPIERSVVHMLRHMLEKQIWAFITPDEIVSELVGRHVGKRQDETSEEVRVSASEPALLAQLLADRASRLGARTVRLDYYNLTFWARLRGRSQIYDCFLRLPRSEIFTQWEGQILPMVNQRRAGTVSP